MKGRPTRVDYYVLNGLLVRLLRVRGGALLQETQDLVHFGGKEVQRRQDAAVGAEVVLPHHLLVVDGIADVDIAFEGDIQYGGVEVDDIRGLFFRMQMCVDALHEGCFARPCHADADDSDGRVGRRRG